MISQECTKNVGFKLIFQAMLNSYDEVILSNLETDLGTTITRYFRGLFQPVIQRIKKEFVGENHKRLFAFFKTAFGLTLAFHKQAGSDMAAVRDVEQAIADSYMQFVVKMNEEQLRPLVVKQVKHAFKADVNKHKAIVFFRTVNTVLNGMKEFFVPLLPLYFDKLLEVLVFLGGQQQHQESNLKRKRDQVDFESEEKHQHTFYELLQLALETLRLNFTYDTNSFI